MYPNFIPLQAVFAKNAGKESREGGFIFPAKTLAETLAEPRVEMSQPTPPPDAGRPTCSDADGDDGPIYLDYNATTPLDPAVAAAMLPVSGLLVSTCTAHRTLDVCIWNLTLALQYLQGRFGNPSSGHWYGVKEKVP